MDLLHQRELAFSLSVPYCTLQDLRRFALVSHSAARIVFPCIFQTMRLVETSRWGSCEILGALSSPENPWRHAHLVRYVKEQPYNSKCQATQAGKADPIIISNITIQVEKSSSISVDVPSFEVIVAAVISGLPNVQNVQIISKLHPSLIRSRFRPARNFEPIAKALASSSRLCSVDISGPWYDGWTGSINSLRSGGEYVRNLGITITAARDGPLYAAFCSLATRLEDLDLRGMVDPDMVETIIKVLPRPDRLRSLKLEMKQRANGWWPESFFDDLVGLRELEITNAARWLDYDHSTNTRDIEQISYSLPTDNQDIDKVRDPCSMLRQEILIAGLTGLGSLVVFRVCVPSSESRKHPNQSGAVSISIRPGTTTRLYDKRCV